MDADITKCFDRISPPKLLKKLDVAPNLRRQIKAWLHAGTLEGDVFTPTEAGTPQGGCISPLLANIALHGLETVITAGFSQREVPPTVVRYADDFVVLHKDREVVEQCQRRAEEWLGEIGLELKPSKTQITHTLEKKGETGGEAEAGFDFLGFHIRQHRVGKTHCGTDAQGRRLGFKTFIRPSKKAIERHTREIRAVVDSHLGAPQEALIRALNLKITGWTNYYSKAACTPVFSKLDHGLFYKLLTWGKRRHGNKPTKWLIAKYWRRAQGQGWRFGPEGSPVRLRRHNETRITYHVKVQGRRSPYDGDWWYWSTRQGRSPQCSPRVARLMKEQRGRCAICQLRFAPGDVLEVDHIEPKRHGGASSWDNWQLLHRHCHDSKTAQEATEGMHDKHQ